MINIELSTLVNKLNKQAKLALEEAAALCVSQQNSEVTMLHLLFTFMENPLSDMRVILKEAGFSHEDVKHKIGNCFTQQNENQIYPAFSPLLVELLQDAWLLSTTDLKQVELRSGAIFIAALMRAERYFPSSIVELFSKINRESLRKNFDLLVENSSETSVEVKATTSSVLLADDSYLSRFCSNFAEQAKNGQLDPVSCRDEEINLMIDILCRRRKNNPIVVGDAGVGKSAVVEGLALRIAAGKVPKFLENVEIVSLDFGALQAGASVKGEFEKRLKGVIDEIKSANKSIILFIDEAHMLIGAGNQEGGDAANLLKPALARGELSTIAATTWKEYKKYFEKDPALTRRFQLIKINEPTIEQATTILRGLYPVYEKAHNVFITDDALTAAASLSARYVSGRQLPDKAIDVLDTACARVAINLTSPPKKLSKVDSDIHQLDIEIKMLMREEQLCKVIDNDRLQRLVAEKSSLLEEKEQLNLEWIKQKALVEDLIATREALQHSMVLSDEIQAVENSEIDALKDKLSSLSHELAAIKHQKQLLFAEVGSPQIAQVIADWTGVPLSQMSGDELHKITELPSLLTENIKGQDVAIEVIHRHMLTARADLRRPGRPKGAFLLVGPSGVGKTETVIQLTKLLYGGNQFLTTINMSEYQEKHTVSRLIGSPPGYVGYGEGGILTEAIRKAPYSVVLLDEVEKAHPDVLNLFYQAFDKGELADGEGRIIDCQNIVFFLTSNLGYQTIVEYSQQPELLEDKLYPTLAEFFKPALLARMEVVPYLPLTADILRQIVHQKLDYLATIFMQRYQADIVIDPLLVDEIMNRITRTENGARMLDVIIEGQLLPSVSLSILNVLSKGEDINEIHLEIKEGQFFGGVKS